MNESSKQSSNSVLKAFADRLASDDQKLRDLISVGRNASSGIGDADLRGIIALLTHALERRAGIVRAVPQGVPVTEDDNASS